VIVLADSSPLITLARARYFELLHEFYGEVIVSREVHHEITVAGAGLPAADEMERANWIRVQPNPAESSPEVKAACAGLGAGERSIIYLASTLNCRPCSD
jgi:predicted nucleic acid-binding protein